jgi:hypothetical protein
MRYTDAMASVLDAFFATCTKFGGEKSMPDLKKLSAQEAFPILLEHAKNMHEWGMPALGEMNLFFEEYHITRLLLLIAYLGLFTDEIPITPKDISDVDLAFNSLISAGWTEERQTIHVLKDFIAAAMTTRELPPHIRALLGS